MVGMGEEQEIDGLLGVVRIHEEREHTLFGVPQEHIEVELRILMKDFLKVSFVQGYGERDTVQLEAILISMVLGDMLCVLLSWEEGGEYGPLEAGFIIILDIDTTFLLGELLGSGDIG